MASPFAVFRKNQKGLMVALVALAMFAFIIMGNGDPNAEGSGLVFVLMVVCAVGGIAWGFGMKQGKGVEWAGVGAIGALIVVGVFWYFSRPPEYVETNAGNLSQKKVRELVDQRQIANQFLQSAYAAANPMPTELPPVMDLNIDDPALGKQLAQFQKQQAERQLAMQQLAWRQGIESQLFDYGSGFGENSEAVERDVVFGFLLSKEADRLGVNVSEKAVNEFIQQVTAKRLSATELRRILDNMRVGQTRIMDALRYEMRNRLAYQLLQPVTYTTPEEYWDIYRQLTVKERLEATAIPVAAFVDESAKPSDAELKALFDTYQRRQPNGEKPGDPGFVQPYKVRAGYLVIDNETVEQSIDVPTETEIALYYDENKESYRNRSLPLGEHPDFPGFFYPDLGEPSGPTLDPFDAPFDVPPLDAPKSDTPDNPRPAENESDPADPDAVERDATEPNDARPDDADPNVPKSDAANPSEADSSESSPDNSPADDAEGDDAEGDDAGGDADKAVEESSALSVPGRALLSVSDDTAPEDDPAPSEAATEDSADVDEPAEDAPADPKPAAPQPEDPQPEDPQPVDPKPVDPQPEDSEPAAEATDAPTDAVEAGPGTPAATEPEEPEFKPLDEVRDEIRRTLVNRRTRERIEELVTAATEEMNDLGASFERRTLDSADPMTMRDVHAQMVAYAKEHGMDYVTTPLISQPELAASPDYPLVDAREANADPRGGGSVLGRLYDGADSRLLPIHAVGPLGNTQYLIWKTADVPAHYPMLATKTAAASAKLTDVAAELGFSEGERLTLFYRSGTLETLGEFFTAHFEEPIEKGQSIPLAQFELVASEVSNGKVVKLQLHEPGVREEVVAAWRMLQARPKAEKRAEELAKLAQEKPGTELGVAFAEETVTGTETDGAEKGQSLEVRETNEFSWLTRSSVPGRDFDEPGLPRLSSIAGIEGAGPPFMEKVFREMQNGDIGVVPNFDLDTYYVVKVKERTPLDLLGSRTYESEFMSVVKSEANPQSRTAAYAAVAAGENRLVDGRWANALIERYQVEFNR